MNPMPSIITILLALLLTASTASAATRTDYFATDFGNGLPEGTVCIDGDGATLHFTMVQAGFDQGDSWKVFTLNGESYAASPARHKTSKGEAAIPANDWMILPAVRIMDTDATLAWSARTIAESTDEGCSYEIRISTTGNQPEDFTGAPAYIIDEESLAGWTEHTVSLSSYAGREVWIALVHTSLNREILAVDRITVSGGPGLYSLTDTTPRTVYGTAQPAITATLRATAAERPITAFTATCTMDGHTLTRRYANLTLTADGETCPISFELNRTLNPGERLAYTLDVKVDGNTAVEQPPLSGSVLGMLFETTRRVVIEEGTGMWCGYCPRGIVAMRQMKEYHPDDCIGVAVHYDDVLGTAVSDYCSALQFPSFPSAYVNRTVLCPDPLPQQPDGSFSLALGLERCYADALREEAPADLELTWTILPGGQLGLVAAAHFAVSADDADYRFTAVAVEDAVTHPSYYQTNYYSGSATPLGGFEQEDKKIVPFTFDEVARASLLPFEGKAGSLPSSIHAGERYAFASEMKAPVYNDLSHVHVVLMLIDAHTGEVVNAVQSPAASAADYNTVLSAVNTISAPNTEAPTRVYTLDGKRIAAPAQSNNRLTICEGKKRIL